MDAKHLHFAPHSQCLDEIVYDVLTTLVIHDVLTTDICIEKKGSFEDSECHPGWPKVADTVIEARRTIPAHRPCGTSPDRGGSSSSTCRPAGGSSLYGCSADPTSGSTASTFVVSDPRGLQGTRCAPMTPSCVVVDASVAVKWVLPEEHIDRAHALMTASIEARQRIVGPPHLPVEVINAIYQRRRRGEPQQRL